jgi:hypothetical protein
MIQLTCLVDGGGGGYDNEHQNDYDHHFYTLQLQVT